MDSPDDLTYAAADLESTDLAPHTHIMPMANLPSEDLEKEKLNFKLVMELLKIKTKNRGATGCADCAGTEISEGLAHIATCLEVTFPSTTRQDPAKKDRMGTASGTERKIDVGQVLEMAHKTLRDPRMREEVWKAFKDWGDVPLYPLYKNPEEAAAHGRAHHLGPPVAASAKQGEEPGLSSKPNPLGGRYVKSEKIVREALNGLREMEILLAVDGKPDDSDYYSTPPAAGPVKGNGGAGPPTRMPMHLDAPISGPSGIGIAAERKKAPAVDAQPTPASQGPTLPPQAAMDSTAIDTTDDRPTMTNDLSPLLGRPWQAQLTIEEAAHALSCTPPAHPHHAANLFALGQLSLLRYDSTKERAFLTLALQHIQQCLPLFPGALRLIPVVSICHILGLQGNPIRAYVLLREELDIEITETGVFTLVGSGRPHGEHYSAAQEAEHVGMAIMYMTEELAITRSQGLRGWLLLTLSCIHNHRFMATHEGEDLDMAIEYLTELTGLRRDPDLLRMLARYHNTRYLTSKALTDLDAAAAALDAAAALPPAVTSLLNGEIYTKRRPDSASTAQDNVLRAEMAYQRWQDTDLIDDLRDALDCLHPVFDPPDVVAKPHFRAMLSRMRDTAFGFARILGDHATVKQTVDVVSNVFNKLPAGHEKDKTAVGLMRLLSQLGNGYGLDPVAQLEAEVDAIDPEEKPELYFDRLAILSGHLVERFESSGNPADITDAVEKMEIVVAVTEPVGPRYLDRAERLSTYFYMRHKALGDPGDLDSAILYGEMSLADAPEPLQQLPGGESRRGRGRARSRPHSLATAYLERFERAGSEADLEKARELALVAARQSIGESDPALFGCLLGLGKTYRMRFQTGDADTDLDNTIELWERMLELAPKTEKLKEDEWGQSLLAMVTTLLSDIQLTRYRKYGRDDDRAAGTRHSEEALRLAPPGHEGHAGALVVAGSWIMYQYGRHIHKLSREDLDRAAEYMERAREILPRGSGDWVRAMEATGTINRLLAAADNDRGGATIIGLGLEELIERYQEMLAVLPPGRSRWDVTISLSQHYGERYELRGDLDDIERAVEHSHAALSSHAELEPILDPGRGPALSMLSRHLMTRYKRLGALEDLDMAIATAREALECTPAEAHKHPDRLIELCQKYMESYLRRGPPAYGDLLTAISLGERCMEVTAGRVGPAYFQIILADALHLRHTADPTLFHDLERAISLVRGALTASVRLENTIRSISMNDYLHRLGKLFRSRFRCTRLLHDIDTAITHLAQATNTSFLPDSQPLRGEILDDLGRCYLIRHQANQGTGPDGERSLHCFREASNLTSTPPLVRIRAAQRVGQVYARSGRWADAAGVYESCVKLMPRISLPFLSRVDQQRLLAMLTGVPSQAATCALLAGRGAIHALKLLEMGRGIIAGFLIDCRSDVTELNSSHPHLWRQFTALRREMEEGLATPLGAGDVGSVGPEGVMARRKKLTANMGELLGTVRSLPGYEDFLRPPSGESLMALAASGPIVVVNANATRCDAIMVTSTAITSTALDKWEWESARQMLDGMKDHVKGGIRTYAARTKKMQALLVWLWDVVVSPVLTALGIGEPAPQAELPQVWWIGTGPLGLAPFHAAGHHKNGSTLNTISRVVSSYTPNIKALQYSSQRKPVESIKNMLLVSMPTTEGQCELEGATEEVQRIVGIVQPAGVVTELVVHPGVPEVLSSLGDSQVVHFACHGVINAEDPSSGGLLLRGGRLTVADVAAKSGCAMMAYLSACSTAQTGDSLLVDEGITLAGAFQMAGFRHVVATMWEGRDEVCVTVAESFYEDVMKGRGVAKALHDAVVKARGVGGRAGKVLDWAPFIHNGA